MTEERFWEIVEEIGWPEIHYDVAKRRFMETHPEETAVAFASLFRRFKSELYKQAGLTAISDSCDDNLAHIIGLGLAEYRRNMDAPHLIWEREERIDYKESFAYCIPFEEEYADDWPEQGYAIPNFVKTLEAYRL